MRQMIWTALAVGVLAFASVEAPAQQRAKAHRQAPEQAAAAERYGSPTAYQAPGPGKGYSADARRRADCLASYPGYDWRTDRIQGRNGESRPCPL